VAPLKAVGSAVSPTPRCDPKVPEADVTLERFAARRLRAVEKWQAEGYPCPPAGVTLDLEAATVSLGDALGDG
jgi:hypothetical protein